MPATLYWTLSNSQAMPPEPAGLLSPAEFQKFSAFRFPKRRDDWLLGRWTAKALAHSLPAFAQYPLDQIEIHNSAEGVPHIRVPGKTTPQHCLSISHSAGSAFCALAVGPDLHIGADLEKIEARTETFILDYFTPGERQLVSGCPGEARAALVTLIWSAKEAMLKALGVGLRLDTRAVEVRRVEGILVVEAGKWQKIELAEALPAGRVWAGWWQRRAPFILTLAEFANPPADMQSVHLVEQSLKG